jgi:hypothetical protein
MVDTRPPSDSAVVDLTLVEMFGGLEAGGWKLWGGVWRRWDGMKVVGVGLLKPQTANGERELLDSLSCCNPVTHQLPASNSRPNSGDALLLLPQGPC